MAQAIAICTCRECGATFKATAIKHTRKEADSWEEWARDHYDLCSNCEEAKRAKKASELTEKAKAEGLPELKGSEKQIAWAEQLRATRLENVEIFIKKYIDNTERCEDPERKARYIATIPHIEKAAELLKQHDYAGWWIDNRTEETKHILSALYKAYKAKMPVEDSVKAE